MDSYLTGLVVMTGVFVRAQLNPLPTVPDIGQLTVEVRKVLVKKLTPDLRGKDPSRGCKINLKGHKMINK